MRAGARLAIRARRNPGFSLPDVHSPNERLRTEYVPLGIAAARALFGELAGL